MPFADASVSSASLPCTGEPSLTRKAKPSTPHPPTPAKIAFIRGVKSGKVTANQIFTMDSDGTAQTQLTACRDGALFPRWSPDFGPNAAGYQGFIAYVGDGRGIWLVDSTGANPTQATSANFRMAGSPDWSPNGRYIAFRVFSNEGIYVHDCVTGQTILVAGPETGMWGFRSVSWSPDNDPDTDGYQGKLLIGCSGGPNAGTFGTYAPDATDEGNGLIVGVSPQYVVYGDYAEIAQTPAGGLRIAYNEGCLLWVADVQFVGGAYCLGAAQSLALPQAGLVYCEPQWSWDGTRIALSVYTPGTPSSAEVYQVAVPAVLGDAASWSRLTTNSVADWCPSWSPPVF